MATKAASVANWLIIIAVGVLPMPAATAAVSIALVHHESGLGMQPVNWARAAREEKQYTPERDGDTLYGILGTAIVAWTRGGTPVRVGVFVDVYMGAEDARAVKPLERPGRTP